MQSVQLIQPKPAPLKLDKPLYDIDGLLELLPIGRSSIYIAIKDGRLRASKMKRRTVFLADDVLAFLETMRV